MKQKCEPRMFSIIAELFFKYHRDRKQFEYVRDKVILYSQTLSEKSMGETALSN